MDSTILRRSRTAKPSSRISDRLRYLGLPPAMQTSLTVPQTHSLPMSPPGKSHGDTTKLSVEKTSCPEPGRTAPSPSAWSAGFSKAGRRMESISSEVF